MLLRAIQGDITEIPADVIVNAANSTLLGGGGVDGAIHRVAGPQLLAHCRNLGGCPTGNVKLTPGYNLPAKYVIHAVGPIWDGPSTPENIKAKITLLRSCYYQSMLEAEAVNAGSIAFPCISTGAYGFPPERAAPVAVETVRSYFQVNPNSTIGLVYFVCFDHRDLKYFDNLLP